MYEMLAVGRHGAVLARRSIGDRRRLVIGRSTQCDIVLSDPMISRVHAELVCIDELSDEWVLRDLGSLHGVWAGGERTTEVVVERGLQVRLGRVRVVFGDLGARLGREISDWLDAAEPDEGELDDGLEATASASAVDLPAVETRETRVAGAEDRRAEASSGRGGGRRVFGMRIGGSGRDKRVA